MVSHNIFSHDVESVDEYCMSYDKIKKIQLNDFYRQLTLTGQIDRTYYTDYSLGREGRQWPSDKDGKIKLLLHYEDENMFLEGLTNKTRLQIKQNSTV